MFQLIPFYFCKQCLRQTDFRANLALLTKCVNVVICWFFQRQGQSVKMPGRRKLVLKLWIDNRSVFAQFVESCGRARREQSYLYGNWTSQYFSIPAKITQPVCYLFCTKGSSAILAHIFESCLMLRGFVDGFMFVLNAKNDKILNVNAFKGPN